VAQPWSLVAGIGPEIAQARLLSTRSLKQWPGTVPVGEVGSMDDQLEDEALGIDD
jgi:hypothetical protein